MAMQSIQPRSPKQNGYVERCQRTWSKELYETSSVAVTLDEYRRDARHFGFTTTMSGPMPHLAKGCPSGIYANIMERAEPPPQPDRHRSRREKQHRQGPLGMPDVVIAYKGLALLACYIMHRFPLALMKGSASCDIFRS